MALDISPGPMGSRELGQLAYDKGMRVLAASKAKESAFEIDRDTQGRMIRQGLLSYALVREGLEERQAKDSTGKITIGTWLAFAEQEVPKLFRQEYVKGAVERNVNGRATRNAYLGNRKDTPDRYQYPTLFDFRKGAVETVLATR